MGHKVLFFLGVTYCCSFAASVSTQTIEATQTPAAGEHQGSAIRCCGCIISPPLLCHQAQPGRAPPSCVAAPLRGLMHTRLGAALDALLAYSAPALLATALHYMPTALPAHHAALHGHCCSKK